MANSSSAQSLTEPSTGLAAPFIGRHADLARLKQLMCDPEKRLITLVGSGGIGKTRLALEIFHFFQNEYEDGACFLPLAFISSDEDLYPFLVEKLKVPVPPGVELTQTVHDYLSTRRMLILLDNFEHLKNCALAVRDLLTAAPRVKFLVTSREKIGLQTETLYPLKGFKIPSTTELNLLAENEAIKLFLQKAQQMRQDFTLEEGNAVSVIHICRLVGGSPLGILLAAAWIEHFSPAEIAGQITTNLDFLSRHAKDSDPRHSSMRAVFDSAYHQLSEPQKSVLRKLAPFQGGFDLSAALAVSGADLPMLISLVDRSLLARNPETGRYELHALLHQYARKALEAAGELEETFGKHAAYYVGFLCDREKKLISRSQSNALDEIQNELGNLRQAYLWIVSKRDLDSLQSALPVFYGFCDMRSRLYEGEAVFRHAAGVLEPQPGERAHPAWALALLSWYDMRTYQQRLDSLDDISTLARLCHSAMQSGGHTQGLAAACVLLGAIAEDQKQFAEAIKEYKEALRIYPSLDDFYWVNMRIGLCHMALQQYDRAIEAFQMCRRSGEESGEHVKLGWSILNIGDTLLLQHLAQEAEAHLERALTLFLETGTQFGILWAYYSLARTAEKLGQRLRAKEFTTLAGELARRLQSASWTERIDNLERSFSVQSASQAQPTLAALPEPFSSRELEILKLLKSELSGPEIAARLVVSMNTIRFHTKNIYRKLGVNSRLEAIRRAKELGL